MYTTKVMIIYRWVAAFIWKLVVKSTTLKFVNDVVRSSLPMYALNIYHKMFLLSSFLGGVAKGYRSHLKKEEQ